MKTIRDGFHENFAYFTKLFTVDYFLGAWVAFRQTEAFEEGMCRKAVRRPCFWIRA